MFRRMAALIFVIAIAGQAWAGICTCDPASQDVHSCCKRKSGAVNYLSGKGCCESSKCISTSESPSFTSGVTVPTITSVEVSPSFVIPYVKTVDPDIHRTVVTKSYDGYHHRYARPPDLYVRHNSFLI